MSIITGIHRNQTQIYCLDSQIDQNSEARLIDAFVNWIDLEKYSFIDKGKSKEGHTAYSIQDMLKLYFYAYLNRTRSSRRIEWLCKTNIEVMWLINNLVPSHTSINSFRCDISK